MKRHSVALAAASLALTSLWGCSETHTGPRTIIGSDRVVTETRPVAGVSSVALSGAGRLIVEQTGFESLQIEAEDNVMPQVVSEVSGGRLSLGLAPGSDVISTRPIVYRLTVRDLEAIETSGASTVELPHADLEALRLSLSGSSIATARGRVRWLEVHLSGSSLLRTPDLQSHVAIASVSGASRGLIRVSERLEASVNGVSILEYLGDPVVVSSVSGTSILRRVGP
jgi:hypothetical protein